MRFVQLVMQLVHFDGGLLESLFTGGGDLVEAPAAPSHVIDEGFEQTGALQAVKERIERAGANAIAVVAQFLHHRQAEDRLLARMQQHVHADQTVIELPPVALHSAFIILQF